MKTLTRTLLGLAACLAASAMTHAADARGTEPVPGPAPTQSSVWMTGHWNSEAGQWTWVAGHWETPPSPSASWTEGHWVSSNGSWVWANGSWNVGHSGQNSSVPPVPPSQAEQAAGVSSGAQPVPMVSSPAPYVQGEYVPQGQAPVVTDYGPIEYAPGYAYPDYYYAGSPWYWGPGYYGFGLGIGPVFFGGGHRGLSAGGFGRGGHGGGHFGGGHFGGGHSGGAGHFH